MVWLQRIALLSCVFTLVICVPAAPAEASEGCCARVIRALKKAVGADSASGAENELSLFAFQDEIDSTQAERAGELLAGVSSMQSVPLDPSELLDAKTRCFIIKLGKTYEFRYKGTSFDDLVGEARSERIGREIIRLSATTTYRVFELPRQAQEGPGYSAIFRCNEDGLIVFESVEGFEQRAFNAIANVRRKAGAISCSTDQDKRCLSGVMNGLSKKVYDCRQYGMGLGDVVLERTSSNEIIIKPGPGCLILPQLGSIPEEEVPEEM